MTERKEQIQPNNQRLLDSLTADERERFIVWIDELEDLITTEYPLPLADSTGLYCWWIYFNADFSPTEAMRDEELQDVPSQAYQFRFLNQSGKKRKTGRFMLKIDKSDMRFFGPNWKIIIPAYLICMLGISFLLSLFLTYSIWSIYFSLIVVVPIFNVIHRTFEFVFSGK